MFQITKQDKLDDISDVCVMSDMIRFEDMDKDGRLGLNEFYAAFSKLYSKYVYRLGDYYCTYRKWFKVNSKIRRQGI